MNSILPFGVSRLNTATSKFNLDSGSVIIGLDAGTQLSDIDNVFIGNSAGSKSTMVSESIFIGMYAGQVIETAKKSIIIGKDESSSYLNKNNIISIGYNNIENESVGIGSNIVCTGSNNFLMGKDIVCDTYNSYLYGKDINVVNSEYFYDSLLKFDNNILLDGFNKIGLLDISVNTNIYKSNIFYVQYDFNNYLKMPSNIFTKETDIIFKFKPTTGKSFNFNLGFFINNSNLVTFNFKPNSIEYINANMYSSTPIYTIPFNNNPYLYDTYNIIHIINNDKYFKSLSIYINPIYNGYFIDRKTSKNYTKGLIDNIKNLNINNIKLFYTLGIDNNQINENIFDNSEYNKKYLKEITETAIIESYISCNISSNYTSNLTSLITCNISITYSSNILFLNTSNYTSNLFIYNGVDYYTFNNASTAITFKDFIISVNDKVAYNLAYGKELNIKGANNICIGNEHNIEGERSILIGNKLCYGTIYKDSSDSIIIGNSNLINNFSKKSIIIGNNNFNDINNDSNYYKFIDKHPVIIGNNIFNTDYNINFCDTIAKYEDPSTCNELLLTGIKSTYNNFLPVAIGFSSNSEVPIKGIYTLNYDSNIYYDIEYSNITSNYIIDGSNYIENITLTTSNLVIQTIVNNNKDLYDTKYGLYVKNKIYSDGLSLYNFSNYSTTFIMNDTTNQNIFYKLPDLKQNYNKNNTLFLSYKKNTYENIETADMQWNTMEEYLSTTDIYAKNITTGGFIYSSNFIGIGSNLINVNLSDRNTSLLEEGSNLYYTSERVGIIAHASNVKAMNYTLLTSNELLNKITSLNTGNIPEGKNLYYTSNRWDERLLTKTLDNIYNGSSNKYITNDIYTNNLLITGTLTVGKIQVIGVDFNNNTNVSFASKSELDLLKQQVQILSTRLDLIESSIKV